MIEEVNPCLQLARQLQAVENAIVNANALIHDSRRLDRLSRALLLWVLVV
jgi:DNA-binding FrmR family transcriptional regulator